jgi:hypothetical protein
LFLKVNLKDKGTSTSFDVLELEILRPKFLS